MERRNQAPTPNRWGIWKGFAAAGVAIASVVAVASAENGGSVDCQVTNPCVPTDTQVPKGTDETVPETTVVETTVVETTVVETTGPPTTPEITEPTFPPHGN